MREVAKALATEGYFNERGKPYAAKSVASMLALTAHLSCNSIPKSVCPAHCAVTIVVGVVEALRVKCLTIVFSKSA